MEEDDEVKEKTHMDDYERLAVMTIVGLHDFIKVSTSASFKSFALILCIDAPESATNSFLKFQRRCKQGTYFPETRRMLLFGAPLI